MDTYALDFETYYDKHCSIKSLGPLGYFSHHDFDAYMVSVVGDNGYNFVGHPKDFDWSILNGSVVLSHNASFDETLYLYGVSQNWWPEVSPAEWYCTADMAAACGLPRSLKNATAQAFKLEISKSTRDNMAGKKWENMSEDFKKEVSEYALKDSELCLRLWKEYGPKWSEFERSVSRMNRKIVQRGLPIDTALLEQNLQKVRKTLFDTEQSIPWAGEQPLLSRKAFDNECIKMGIEPPASLALTDEDAQDWIRRHGFKYQWIEAVSNYRRINSLLKKLESFDAATMPDNRYYGGIMYFGSHTGRFSGSGGNLNLQNMPREEMFGANIRHMIAAPEGRKLVAADLSNIEVRTLCWLAGDMETLEEISKTDDIYEAFAIRFGLWDKAKGKLKSDPKLRHKVKALVLGCFGPDTKVLTERGWVSIIDVRDTDKVWDGTQWTNHEGLLHQGVRETVTKFGLEATPEHEILTEHGWQEWKDLLSSEKDLKSALCMATLPSCFIAESSMAQESLGGIPLSDVVADGKEPSIVTTSKAEKLRGAISVLRKLLRKLPCADSVTQKLFQTRPTVSGCLTGSARSITDATTRMTVVTQDTVLEGYGFTSNGSIIAQPSSNILCHLRDGISQTLNWIGSITTEAMNQTIFGLFHGEKTAKTNDPCPILNSASESLRRKSDVYDLKNCGPNNRYTVLTDHGPIVVHNCGYGAGAAKFAQMYGMPMEEAEEAVNIYRNRLSKIPEYWRTLNNKITQAHSIVSPFQLTLPSGRVLDYGRTKLTKVEGRAQHVAIMNRNGKRLPMKLWGGILAENCSQAMARDVLCYQMLEIEKAGLDIILHVHDEIIVECDEADAEKALETMNRIMSTAPEWCSNLPLSSEGYISQHYTK